jgi:hypothetical protein
VVFVVWEPMLPMSLGLAQVSLRDAVDVWYCTLPPVNWWAIFGGP